MVKGVSIETVQGLLQTDYKSAKNTLFQTVMFECMRVRRRFYMTERWLL
jgi:hypothetical protein